ncbi:MAG: hypothetical protein H0U81_00090 [Pyrinomonadaceae bacterium]|nr:hypothetical protein [Pyrinomonadaceae bacterium]
MTFSLMKSLLCLALLLIPQAAQKSVPVGEEPRHRVVFSNKYVRVIDAEVRAGDTTLFHTHTEDNVPVAISGGRMRTEVMGGKVSESSVETGGVWFARGTYTHKISNTGRTTLRFIDAEILASPGTASSDAPLDKVPGLKLEIENERVRIYRVKLAPGQKTGMHSHALAGLDVAITRGKVAVVSGDRQQKAAEVKPGEFSWRAGAGDHSIENVGQSIYEAVEIEWK